MSKSGWDSLRKIADGRSGLRVGNAFDVGIKRDQVPAHIQELADSIKPPESDKSKNLSRKLAHLKKYNIKDGTATIGPEMFRELFIKPTGLALLQDNGVTNIKISSGDVEMTFELFDASIHSAGAQSTPSILTRDIVTTGIVQAAGFEEKLRILRNHNLIGFLTVHSTDQTIARLGKQAGQGDFHTTEWAGVGNAIAVFKDSPTLETAAYQYRNKGGLNLTRHFQNDSGKTEVGEVGTLLHHTVIVDSGRTFKDLRKIQIQHVAGAIESSKASTQDQLTSDIFRAATQGYALYAGTKFSGPPLAVLIPPKKDLL